MRRRLPATPARLLASGLIAGMMTLSMAPAFAWMPSVPVVPYSTASQQIETSEYLYLSKASALLQSGQDAAALNDLITTLDINPINILALFHLGSVYLELAKRSDVPEQQAIFLDQSEKAFERVINLNDELTLVYFKLGKIALLKGDLGAAKKAYERGLKTDPHNAALIFNLARVYDQQGNKDQAIEAYQHTLAVDPQFTFAHNNLALLYEEQKNYKAAEKVYRQAIKQDPKYNLARLNLGNMYASLGKYEAAEKTLAEASTLEPENEWVYFYQGNLY